MRNLSKMLVPALATAFALSAMLTPIQASA